MPGRKTLIIADDHPIVRKGLVKIIEQEDDYEILAESGDGSETLKLIERLHPDIVVLDISMPGLDGLKIMQEAKKTNLTTKFIILTMYDDSEYFEQAMELGALGYLLKENAVNELMDCLNAVSEGRNYICPEISGYLVNRNYEKKLPSPLDTLTRTEIRILRLISENMTSKQIADELCVSLRTVQNHRNNIVHKLGLQGHNKLLQFALENKKFL
jgi:DNA-binding NarL/FixJ family response regulator